MCQPAPPAALATSLSMRSMQSWCGLTDADLMHASPSIHPLMPTPMHTSASAPAAAARSGLQSAGVAAVREMATMGPQLAVPLLEYGESWPGR